MIGPRPAGRRTEAPPRQRLHLVADNTGVALPARRIDRWGPPALRFALLLLASVALWALIAYGLWRLAVALA